MAYIIIYTSNRVVWFQEVEGTITVDLNERTITQQGSKTYLPTNLELFKIETSDYETEKQNLIDQDIDVSVIDQYEENNINWHFPEWNYRILFELKELVDEFYALIPYAKQVSTLKEQEVGITGKKRYLYIKEEIFQSHYDFITSNGKEIETNPDLPDDHEIVIIEG